MRASKNQGFTLIELMVVVAIIGIIAAVALPSYLESVNKSRRGEAKAEMTALAQQLERCFTRNNTYASCDQIGSDPILTSSQKHEIKVTVNGGGLRYKVTATPQYTDSRCGTLTINNVGVKTSSTENIDCW